MFKLLLKTLEVNDQVDYPFDDEADEDYKPYHYCKRCKVSMRAHQKECHYCGETT